MVRVTFNLRCWPIPYNSSQVLPTFHRLILVFVRDKYVQLLQFVDCFRYGT